MGRTLALLALVISSIGPVPRARADGPVVLARLPVERHDEMMAALRLELAGRAEVIDGARVEDGATTEGMRAEAREAGATHAVWIAFPGGALRPAEVRVLRLDRSAAAHGMTPQAWDVVDARLVAVIAGSLLESEGAGPVRGSEADAVAETESEAETEAETETESETETDAETETVTETEAEIAAPAPEVEAPGPDPRRARRFSLLFGLGYSHLSAPQLGVPAGTARWSTELGNADLGLSVRLVDWASIALRVRLTGYGYSSLEGPTVSGVLSVPSLALSFREALGTVAMLELGMHVEGALVFYGRNASHWSFGIGGGVFATLELGPANGIQLDYTIDGYGFADAGAYEWGALTLSYVYRFD